MKQTLRILDGPAIRNANRGDSCKIHSRESIRRKKNYFHDVRAIRTNRLKPAETRSARKRDSVREPSSDLRESSDLCESANRFARVGHLSMEWLEGWNRMLSGTEFQNSEKGRKEKPKQRRKCPLSSSIVRWIWGNCTNTFCPETSEFCHGKICSGKFLA